MGIQHLQRIEQLLSKNKKEYSLRNIIVLTHSNYYAIRKSLDYLEEKGKISARKEGIREYIRWKK